MFGQRATRFAPQAFVTPGCWRAAAAAAYHVPMELADRIRAKGFRKWYEGRLAEFLGGRSTCPKYEAYARFRLLYTGPRNEPALPEHLQETPVLVVECKKCGAGWRM